MSQQPPIAYASSNAAQGERERLASLEAQFDPPTVAALEAAGIKEGWQCLEIGAGGGSIADWLCTRVGPEGRVVATDIDTRFVSQLEHPNLEVRQHDVTQDELDAARFDLVHARAVITHLPNRENVLRRMGSALKDGRPLVIEAPDWSEVEPIEGKDELFSRVLTKCLGAITERGGDLTYGLRLADDMRRVGFGDVSVDEQIYEWGGDAPLTAFFMMSFERVTKLALESGALKQAEIDQFFNRITSPNFRGRSFRAFIARGVR